MIHDLRMIIKKGKGDRRYSLKTDSRPTRCFVFVSSTWVGKSNQRQREKVLITIVSSLGEIKAKVKESQKSINKGNLIFSEAPSKHHQSESQRGQKQVIVVNLIFSEAPSKNSINSTIQKKSINRHLIFSEAPSKLIATAVDQLTHSIAKGLKTGTLLKYEDVEIYGLKVKDNADYDNISNSVIPLFLHTF